MRRAIYAGSFDPITNGHCDIINRAKQLFDEVTVLVVQNPAKQSFLTREERVALISEIYKDDAQIAVDHHVGLLAHYAKDRQINTLIRGLRAVSDFDYEFQMALTNKDLHSQIDTVFLMTDKAHSYLSSSMVRQLAQFNGDVSQMVPSNVQAMLRKKYERS